MSGSCHLDRALNDKFSVECLFWFFQPTWKADSEIILKTRYLIKEIIFKKFDFKEEICEPTSSEVCSEPETVQECTDTIKKVPETMCTTVDSQKCEIIEDEVCSPVYETKCTPVTTQSCR